MRPIPISVTLYPFHLRNTKFIRHIYALLKKIKISLKKKNIREPWMTQALSKSSQTLQRLYKKQLRLPTTFWWHSQAELIKLSNTFGGCSLGVYLWPSCFVPSFELKILVDFIELTQQECWPSSQGPVRVLHGIQVPSSRGCAWAEGADHGGDTIPSAGRLLLSMVPTHIFVFLSPSAKDCHITYRPQKRWS